MSNLKEIIHESVGKSSYHMRGFFQKLLDRREINAFSAEVDKQTVEKDDESETLVRKVKGLSLTPATEIKSKMPYVITFPQTDGKYHLSFESHGGTFTEEGDSSTSHNTTLEKLGNAFVPRQVGNSSHGNQLSIPDKMIVGRIQVDYTEDWYAGERRDFLDGTSGSLTVHGENDALFRLVCKYVKEE